MSDDNINNENLNPDNQPVPEEISTEPDFENVDVGQISQPENDDAAPASTEVKIEDSGRNYDEPVTVRPVEFTAFDSYTPTNTDTNKNLELLMDIKLELTVELGRCQLPVKKVLELTRGSIVELDKIAGEQVELFANGKHIANGEVVVIEDNFGLRITSISEPEERIKALK